MGSSKHLPLEILSFSAPYMHDGRFNTLEQVVNFYSDSIEFSSTIDPLMKKSGYWWHRINDSREERFSSILKNFL